MKGKFIVGVLVVAGVAALAFGFIYYHNVNKQSKAQNTRMERFINKTDNSSGLTEVNHNMHSKPNQQTKTTEENNQQQPLAQQTVANFNNKINVNMNTGNVITGQIVRVTNYNTFVYKDLKNGMTYKCNIYGLDVSSSDKYKEDIQSSLQQMVGGNGYTTQIQILGTQNGCYEVNLIFPSRQGNSNFLSSIISSGYALVPSNFNSSNYNYYKEIVQAQDYAKTNKLGLWDA